MTYVLALNKNIKNSIEILTLIQKVLSFYDRTVKNKPRPSNSPSARPKPKEVPNSLDWSHWSILLVGFFFIVREHCDCSSTSRNRRRR